MWYSGIQKEEQAKSVIGEVFDNPISRPNIYKNVWRSCGSIKLLEVEETKEIDKKHYFSDHARIIENGYCRECSKPIGKHSNKYYAKKHIDSVLYSILYCAANGYCAECSYKLGHIYHLNDNPLTVIKHEEMDYVPYGHTVTRTYYNDGSVVEYDNENLPKGAR